jgi:hypothetical protein
MILDSVLGDRRCWWLSPADDKWRFFCLKRDNYLRPEDYPHIGFGSGRERTIRCFPDKLPIGIEKDGTSQLVFVYLVNRRLPVDFQQFLCRHAHADAGTPGRGVSEVEATSGAAAEPPGDRRSPAGETTREEERPLTCVPIDPAAHRRALSRRPPPLVPLTYSACGLRAVFVSLVPSW